MAKFYRFLQVLSLTVLIACGKNSDKEKFAFELLEIAVTSDYLNAPNEKGYIFLSKTDGTLIDFKEFKNSENVTLGTDEAGIESFTATIFVRQESALPYKNRFRSYLEITNGTKWNLGINRENYEIAPDSAKVVVDNVGDIDLYSVRTSTGEYRTSSVYTSSGKLHVATATNEKVSTYLSYKSLTDNKVRYLFDEGIAPGTEKVHEHTSLPIIENATIFNTPTTIGGYIDKLLIKADPVGDNDKKYLLEYFTSLQGSYEYYAPINIFEKIYTYLSGANLGYEFVVETQSTSLPTAFEIPNFDFEATADNSGFSFSSNASIDVFTISFNDEFNGKYWAISSENKSPISFSLPALPEELLNEFSELSNAPVYNHKTASVTKFTPSISYLELTKLNVSGANIEYAKAETIGKDL